MSKEPIIRVLVVDDEIDHADALSEAVARIGYSVKQAHNLADAKRYFAEGDFDLVVTDLRMDSPQDGFELLEWVLKTRPGTQVIVVTAYGDVSTAVQAMRSGAYDFITKPLDLDLIRAQIRRTADKVLLARQNETFKLALDQRYGMEGIIGNSPAMQRALQLVRQIGPTDINVLVLGESGTGKELIARALHQNSRRQAGRFVALNCAGLNDSTLEDELFGHVRGAFTDARSDRLGRFEYADGGTLFMDEIGDMPLTMQAKLLRVLQDRQVIRLGSNEPIQVDVRFIAATNKDLEEAVHKHEFRDDLYFRIKGATILLPPLRQRREDIPVLIEHLMKKSCRRLNKQCEGIDHEARDILISYYWPGNVRQLENVIENMIALAGGPRLTMDDIPPDILGHYSVETVSTTALAPLNLAGGAATGTAITSLAGVSLAELEKEAIQKTLELVSGNREQAAKLLGIGERTLYRKIKEYGVQE
ncbi:MAG: sigma-54-dependent transcriptional regulator [Phycisphaerae bacterium]